MQAAAEYLGIPEMRDMDYVITTRELAQWGREQQIEFSMLEDSEFDRLMGEASGAGVIFGNTGGVMEAALRTAYEYISGEKAPEVLYELEAVRGMEGTKEASLQIGELTVNVAVTPCTAKKYEIRREEMQAAAEYLGIPGMRDMDYVITTR